jgi:hypothetical protein
MIGASITEDHQLKSWLVSVQGLTADEAQSWAGLAYANKASELICSGIWMRKAESTDSTADWTTVMERLDRVRAWAFGVRVGPLAIHSLRGQIIVAAEYQNELGRALTLAENGLTEHTNDAQAQFWISEIMARQFYYQNRQIEALHWFERVFSLQVVVEPAPEVNALVLAAAAAAGLSLALSIAYLQRAIARVETVPKETLPSLLSTQVWGELAIARWSEGDQRASYDAWRRAVEELLAAKEDTDNWRILFRMIGNFSGYFAMMTESPERASWPYAVPEAGILMRLPRAVLTLYEPGRDWLISAQMALFADGVGAYEDAVEWSVRLLENPEHLPLGMDALIRRYRLPRLLEEQSLAPLVVEATTSSHDHNTQEAQTQGVSHDESERIIRFAEESGRLDLVAVAIELARRLLKTPESGAELTNDVSAACREAAVRGEALAWWAGAGDAIASLTAAPSGWRNLYEQGLGLMNSDTELAIIYYIAAMLRAEPKYAVQLQMAVILWLKTKFSKTLFHFTISSLVAEYWDWALAENWVYFSNLRVTRSDIEAARSFKGEERLRRILQAVTTNLGVEPATPEMKHWLLDRQ